MICQIQLYLWHLIIGLRNCNELRPTNLIQTHFQLQPAASFYVLPICCSPAPLPRSCWDQCMQLLWIKHATAACLLWSQLVPQWAPPWCVPAGGRREGSCCSWCVETDRSVCSGMDSGFPPSIPRQHTAELPPPSTVQPALQPLTSLQAFPFRNKLDGGKKNNKKLSCYSWTYKNTVVPCAPVFLLMSISECDSLVSLLTQVLVLPLEDLAVTLSNPGEPGHGGIPSTSKPAHSIRFFFHKRKGTNSYP